MNHRKPVLQRDLMPAQCMRDIPWSSISISQKRREEKNVLRRISSFLLMLLVCFLVCRAPFARAQQGTGNIAGTVVDTTGAVVPNADLAIQNVQTQRVTHLTTNGTGFYNSPALNVGSYLVTVTQAGFKVSQAHVTVDVDKRVEANFTLSAGATDQIVEVTSSPPAMNTTSATLGTVLGAKSIHELPLNGRNALALVTLTPGVRNNMGATQQGFGNRGVFLSATSINGSPTGSNGYILDGQNNLQAITGEVVINPTVDAIEEFKVQSGVMSAQYGYTAGGVVNLVSRSGTSKFHGTVYEFLRNDAFDAKNYFTAAGHAIPELRYNQFGAALGGPAIRNRLFFFGNWEEYHYIAGTPQYLSVPTADERKGNFSHLRDSSGAVIPIYDPATTQPNGSNGYTRSEFAGNVIPTSQLDPVALAIQDDYYPLPNNTSGLYNSVTEANNFLFVPKTQILSRQALGRVDFHISESNNGFVRYGYSDNQTNNGAASSTAVPSLYPNPIAANRNDDMLSQSLAIGDTHVFSSTLFNDVRVAALRVTFPFKAASAGLGLPQKLGLPDSVPGFTLPVVSNGLPAFNGTVGFRATTNPQITDTVSKTIGTHQITFGADIRYYIGSNFQQNAPSGTYNFASALTADPQTNAGGSTYATLLLGAVSSASLTVTGGETDRSFDTSFFVQDDWQAMRRLTINAGLRYDYQQQPYEQNNGYSNFAPDAINPLNGFKGAMRYASSKDRNFISDNYHDFGPRLGFALDLTGANKTILRGGYGIYYPPTFTISTGLTNGFASTSTSYNPVGPNVPAFQFYAGLPTPPIQPLGAALGPSGFLGQSVSFKQSRTLTPMSQQWTLSLEQQLPWQIVVEGTYVANRGTHFPEGSLNINQLDPSYLSLGNALQNQVPNPYAGKVPGVLGNKTITRQQSLLAYPYYSTVSNSLPHEGSYNGQYLEISAQKRSVKGLTLIFGYTAGKLLDDSIYSALSYLSAATNIYGFQNIYNPHAEYSLDPTDVSQRATISALYDLPFGANERFRAHNRVVDGIIGGIQLNTIAVFQTGFPLAISGANNNAATRPNFVPGVSPKLSQRSALKWFNTAAFVNPPNYTYGNVPRTLANLRAPGTNNIDLSLFKTAPLPRGASLQFRVEAFNAFNHVNLGAPNTSFTAGGANGGNANGNFGVINTAGSSRNVQLALKLMF